MRRNGCGRVEQYCTAVIMTLLASISLGAFDDSKDAIVKLEHAQAGAIVALDFETLGRLYADDFRFTHGTGVVHGKTDWLESLRTGESVYVSREHEALEVEMHGDLAVSYGQLHIHSYFQGEERWFMARYVRVYVRRDENWQLVSHRTVEQRDLR